MKRKVLWLSRHAMTPEQASDLEALASREGWLGDGLEVVSKNVTWQATADADADIAANSATWRDLAQVELLPGGGSGMRDGCEGFSAIAGVFPPAACEAWDVVCGWTRVVSPVSRQAPEKRVGDGPIPFEHVRWARLL